MDVERAEVELLRRLDAVDQGHHAVAADAADVEAVEPEAGHAVLDVDARLVLHEVGEVLDHPFLNRLAVDDRHHPRRVPHRGRPEIGGDGHGIEEGRRFIGRRFGVGLGRGRVLSGRRLAGVRLREDGEGRRQQQEESRQHAGRRRGGVIEAKSVHTWHYPCFPRVPATPPDGPASVGRPRGSGLLLSTLGGGARWAARRDGARSRSAVPALGGERHRTAGRQCVGIASRARPARADRGAAVRRDCVTDEPAPPRGGQGGKRNRVGRRVSAVARPGGWCRGLKAGPARCWESRQCETSAAQAPTGRVRWSSRPRAGRPPPAGRGAAPGPTSRCRGANGRPRASRPGV